MTIASARTSYLETQRQMLAFCLIPWAVTGCVLMLIDVDPPTLIPFMLGMLILTLAGLTLSWVTPNHLVRVIGFSLWQVVVITLAWRYFPQYPLGCLYLFPVMIAGISSGPATPLGVAMLTSLGMILGRGSILTPQMIDGNLTLYLASILAMAFLCYVFQRSHKTEAFRSWENAADARHHLNLLRDRQLDLKQALSDLGHANQETLRLNDRLSAARQAVQEAQHSKETFVANVSHELRTPLNMIIGFSDLILDAPETYSADLPPTLLADIAAIKRNSEHLSQLVNDVLALAESEADQMRMHMAMADFGKIAQEAIQAVKILMEQKGLDLNLELPEHMPPIYCDQTRIRQVVLNLLGNASRFTERGSVTLSASIYQGMLTVSVADTGPGIEPDRVARVFEPFWQGDPSVRRRYGGTGLGLAISKRFVELHQGKIWIESHMGQGTTVSFSLPIAGVATLDSGERWFSAYGQHETRTRIAHAPLVRSPQALVCVEQEPYLAEMMARFGDDLEIVTAPSAEEALEAANRLGAVGIVINNPYDQARGLWPLGEQASFGDYGQLDVPLFYCQVPERQMALERLGVQGYLTKPITRDALSQVIAQYVSPGGTILVADDGVEARQLFGRMVLTMDRNYVVLDAEDGEEALRLLATRRPDLLLLDLVMPRTDGYEVLKRKASMAELDHIPVVIISAHDPQDEPLNSGSLTVYRQEGLSIKDLTQAILAVSGVLQPRFAPPRPTERRAES